MANKLNHINDMTLEDISKLKVDNSTKGIKREDNLVELIDTCNFRGNRTSSEIARQIGPIVVNNQYISDNSEKKAIIDKYFKSFKSAQDNDFYENLGIDYI